jgi:assimilatory nitrate reductase catalytic subunit
LINAATDPLSGQPEFKHTPVKLEAYAPAWHGFLITTGLPDVSDLTYWTRVPVVGATLYEIADESPFQASIDKLLPVSAATRRIEALDQSRGSMRIAMLDGGRVTACLFIASSADALPARDWLVRQFSAAEEESPIAILAGRPSSPQSDPGPQVCACFNVGLNTLVGAIRDQQLRTVQAVGAALLAGTNCGSCKPKIQSLLKAETPAVVA